MPEPTLCVLLTTIGRPGLARMLQSIGEQDLITGDEVLLVSDDAHGAAAAAWAAAGLPGRHVQLEEGPHRDWGHTPRNKTLSLAKADFVLHADDDDALLPGAFSRVRAQIREHPRDFHVFPFVHLRHGHLVGTNRILAHGHVGTPNFIHPRDAVLGQWGSAHGGDGKFITETVAINPDRQVQWHTEPHYAAYPPDALSLADVYSVGFRVARTTIPGFQLIPAKVVWTDLARHDGGSGREDCQDGWHALAAGLFAGRDLLDVGAGLGHSRPRLTLSVRRLRLQDPGPGLDVDLTCPVSDLPSGNAEAVTAFDVLEHVIEDRRFVEDLLRVASTGVLLTTPNWHVSRAANRHHCREYTPSQLLALLDGLPVARMWAGDPRGRRPVELGRNEFSRHGEPHQAVLLTTAAVEPAGM